MKEKPRIPAIGEKLEEKLKQERIKGYRTQHRLLELGLSMGDIPDDDYLPGELKKLRCGIADTGREHVINCRK